MQKSKIILYSLLHGLGVLAYVVLINFLMTALSNQNGGADPVGAPVMFLMLFVFSVALMGVLVFGRPVYLFLNGAKREAIAFLGYTMMWILILLIIVFAIILKFIN